MNKIANSPSLKKFCSLKYENGIKIRPCAYLHAGLIMQIAYAKYCTQTKSLVGSTHLHDIFLLLNLNGQKLVFEVKNLWILHENFFSEKYSVPFKVPFVKQHVQWTLKSLHLHIRYSQTSSFSKLLLQ